MPANIVATVAGIAIEESCRHFYPCLPHDVEFKTLRQAKIWLLFDYLPRLRFLRQVDLCATGPYTLATFNL